MNHASDLHLPVAVGVMETPAVVLLNAVVLPTLNPNSILEALGFPAVSARSTIGPSAPSPARDNGKGRAGGGPYLPAPREFPKQHPAG